MTAPGKSWVDCEQTNLHLHEPSTNARAVFFDQASDEQFLVLAEVLQADDHELASHISVQTFQHEDVFLERLIAADLPLTDTALLAGTAIGSVGQTLRGRTWVELKLTEKQIGMLGLEGEQYFVRPGGFLCL